MWPIYFLPSIPFVPLYNFYERLFSYSFLDNYLLNASFSYPSLFSVPSLWRYWGMSVQDSLAQNEFMFNLDKSMKDSYYRTLLTASQPPVA